MEEERRANYGSEDGGENMTWLVRKIAGHLSI